MLQLDKYVPVRFKTWLAPALCLLVVGALVAVFLFDVSVSTLLLVTLALACPLSHLFMGHGGHGGHASNTGTQETHSSHTGSQTPESRLEADPR